jgi:hypothetical protein
MRSGLQFCRVDCTHCVVGLIRHSLLDIPQNLLRVVTKLAVRRRSAAVSHLGHRAGLSPPAIEHDGYERHQEHHQGRNLARLSGSSDG